MLGIAVCMDGTPPAYHLDPGSGGGNRSWVVNLEGGGWCNNARTCRFRTASRHGSSDHMERLIAFTGIMSSAAADNPGPSISSPPPPSRTLDQSVYAYANQTKWQRTDFHSWNRVKIRYCDSGSFAGDAFDEVINQTHPASS